MAEPLGRNRALGDGPVRSTIVGRVIFKKLRASFAETREKLDRQKLMDERKPKPTRRPVSVWLTNLDRSRSITVRSGVWLRAVREPNNTNDPNAVALHLPGTGHVGYLAREEARVIAPQIDAKSRTYRVMIREDVALEAGDMVSLGGTLEG